MNEQQQQAYNLYAAGQSFFLTGAAGTGKSYVLSRIMDNLEYRFGPAENNSMFAVTALTGISSLAVNGRTLHSWAGVGLAELSPELLIQRVRKNKRANANWRNCKVCIVDEVSMMDETLFEKMHAIGCAIRDRHDALWGGIQLILAGDFLQLSPASGLEYCLFSPIWKRYVNKIAHLTINVRQQQSEVLQRILGNIRYGIVTPEDRALLDARQTDDLLDEYVADGIVPTRLNSLKRNVEEINTKELSELINEGNPKRTFYPRYELKITDRYNNDEHAARRAQLQTKIDNANNSKTACELIDATYFNTPISLCLGAQVMMTANVDHKRKLVNGQRGVVVGFEEISGTPIVSFDHGLEVMVVSHAFETHCGPFNFVTNQIPLTLAWAITIHKSQSLTISKIEVDLASVFCHGQAYVSLSRVRDIGGLFISSIQYDKITADPRVVQFYKNLSK